MYTSFLIHMNVLIHMNEGGPNAWYKTAQGAGPQDNQELGPTHNDACRQGAD